MSFQPHDDQTPFDAGRWPKLAELLGGNGLTGLLESDGRWPHPLHVLCGWGVAARDQYLAMLDRAADKMSAVLKRSPDSARKKIAAGLANRSQFEATVSELICGARLELLGAGPVMEGGGAGRQPDFEAKIGNVGFFVEVYTPEAGPRDSLLDDVAQRLVGFDADCFVSLDLSRIPRDSSNAKKIAEGVKRVIGKLHAARETVAIAVVPFGKDLGGWQTCVGTSEYSYLPTEPPVFFARFTVDGTSGFRLVGTVDGRVKDTKRDARKELKKLGQLRENAANVLVVDLTAKYATQQMFKDYEEVATKVFTRHPELAAILLTRRGFGLRPAPSIEHELRSSYKIILSTNSVATVLPKEVIDSLATPGLLFH